MIEVGLLLVVGGVVARIGLWPQVRRQAAAAAARRQAEEDAMVQRIADELAERIRRAAG